MINQYEPNYNYECIKKEINKYLESKPYFTEYKKTREFENKIKDFLGVRHCFIVNNGTISLSLALYAQGIRSGDKVLIPDLTMIATANAVKFIGAEPVLCDVNPLTLCMDMDKAEKILFSQPIKGVIYVSLSGRWDYSMRTQSFLKTCKSNGLAVVEDAAQSLGSKNHYGMIGNSKHVTSFSLSMPKIITTGQGGFITTNDDKVAHEIKLLNQKIL